MKVVYTHCGPLDKKQPLLNISVQEETVLQQIWWDISGESTSASLCPQSEAKRKKKKKTIYL